jgi:hypothetical protein
MQPFSWHETNTAGAAAGAAVSVGSSSSSSFGYVYFPQMVSGSGVSAHGVQQLSQLQHLDQQQVVGEGEKVITAATAAAARVVMSISRGINNSSSSSSSSSSSQSWGVLMPHVHQVLGEPWTPWSLLQGAGFLVLVGGE